MSVDRDSALLTDLYQLTMLQAYFEGGTHERAVFEFFVRCLPPCRGFLIAAGLQQLLDYLENLQFTADELDWLRNRGSFRPEFLEGPRLTGNVHAMPEGRVFFADEPIILVTAPITEA